ncbi:hypothetical protein A8709_03605 [Paenibacillus pectinilyticus]|uniref:S-layer protein n=1 Tax=Paenibacillus pectinilyticus TaxID=512399 RepID=A0A1C0ZZ01_9BACL|nr:S-layer homology domain-containing protein [Paenibacillus pectinilyticus]OCT13348.1 hypothetical protein A8709_03605 [Paenibacillus pectinilyticus]
MRVQIGKQMLRILLSMVLVISAFPMLASVLAATAMPSIISQPVGTTVNQYGISPTLSVTASVSDSGILSYQWYRNTTSSNSDGTAISGATSATYATPTGAVGTTYYYVVVTNTNSSTTGSQTATVASDTAAVMVNPTPTPPTPPTPVLGAGGSSDMSNWRSVGLPFQDYVYSLLNVNGTLYARTNSGIWLCSNGTWTLINGSPSNVSVMENINGTLYVGAVSGIWSYSNGLWTLMNGSPSDVKDLENVNGTLYAGTWSWLGDGSYYFWSYNGTSWTRMGTSSPGNVTSLLSNNGTVYAGTYDKGIWLFNGTSWKQMGSNPPGNVYSMKNVNSTLYAGTDNGIWSYNGTSWTQKGINSPSPGFVTAIEDVNGTLYAATGLGVWLYSSGTNVTNGTWTSISPSLVNLNSLLNVNGTLYAAAGNVVMQLLYPPSTPANLQASSTIYDTTTLTLTWDSVSGATGYKIYQNGGNTASSTVFSTTYSLSVPPNTLYTFTVSAFNEAGESTQSGSIRVLTLPIHPTYTLTDLKATSGDGQVTLSWSLIPETGSVTYSVYKGTTSGSYATTPVATMTGSTHSYTASGLTNGTTYYFAVKVRNAGESGDYSNEVSSTPKSSNTSFSGGGFGGGAIVNLPALNSDGKMTYDVQPAHIDMLLDLKDDAKKELTVDATAKQQLDITSVSIPADILQLATELGKPVVIKSNDVSVKIPTKAITINNAADTVKFQVAAVTNSASEGFNTVSPVLEFTLAENKNLITTFKSPIEATFTYDVSKVKDASNLAVYWFDEANNTWVSMGGTVTSAGTIVVSLPHFSKYAVMEKTATKTPDQADTTFSDVQGHWAQKEIQQLVSKQIIDGMGDGLFQPDNNMTRAQFVTILKKALNLSPKVTTKSFTDVAADAWYKDSVYAAYAVNIVSGTGDSTFAPEANVTREELAVMMVKTYLNATGKKLSDFAAQPVNYADVSNISDWAKLYVAVATTLGLLDGVDDTHFAPSQNSTRAEVATVVMRMLKQIYVKK